jgi:hypothetical protein
MKLVKFILLLCSNCGLFMGEVDGREVAGKGREVRGEVTEGGRGEVTEVRVDERGPSCRSSGVSSGARGALNFGAFGEF